MGQNTKQNGYSDRRGYMLFKCEECGKFIGHKDYEAMVYIPYGNTGDLEPPDELYICGKCWRENPQELTIKTAWQKPSRLFKKMKTR